MKTEQENKVNILSLAQAMGNCIKTNNTDWFNKHEAKLIKTLLNTLPHGSGIDCDWTFDITDKMIRCSNSYHRMDEYGGYRGYIDFSVVIKTDHRMIDGRLDYNIKGQFGKYQDLKDYLYDTISIGLDEL